MPIVCKRKEIIKIGVETSEWRIGKKALEKIYKPKRWFYEKANKNGEAVARLSKRKRAKNQITKIRNKRMDITKNKKVFQGSTNPLQTLIKSKKRKYFPTHSVRSVKRCRKNI